LCFIPLDEAIPGNVTRVCYITLCAVSWLVSGHFLVLSLTESLQVNIFPLYTLHCMGTIVGCNVMWCDVVPVIVWFLCRYPYSSHLREY